MLLHESLSSSCDAFHSSSMTRLAIFLDAIPNAQCLLSRPVFSHLAASPASSLPWRPEHGRAAGVPMVNRQWNDTLHGGTPLGSLLGCWKIEAKLHRRQYCPLCPCAAHTHLVVGVRVVRGWGEAAMRVGVVRGAGDREEAAMRVGCVGPRAQMEWVGLG